MADTAYERVLCVKNEVLVYKIPPRQSNRGYRAADWKLDTPDWTGRLRVVAKEKELFIKVEDKNTGELFAQCPVDAYPGIAVEPVTDSSRYFVIRIRDVSGRSASIGIGFHDRSDSFDLNVSLQDHFKLLRQEENAAKASKEFEEGPKLDLGFKEGQTFTLNLGMKKEGKAKPKPAKTGNIGLLPPPPRGGKLPPPSAAPSEELPAPQTSSLSTSNLQNVDLLFDLGSSSSAPPPATTSTNNNSTASQNPPDLWGDFTGASGSQNVSSSSSVSNDWMQF